MTHCVICNLEFASVGLPARGGRKLCPSRNCASAYAKQTRQRVAAESQGSESKAYRSQGQFRILATQKDLCARFTDEFFCWLCHKMHDARAVGELRIECVCGALYTLSLGEAVHGVAIARVDRWR